MCQLTFCNLHDKRLNTLFTTLQLKINTAFQHKDGYGFYSNGEIFKSEKTPNQVTNLSQMVDMISSDLPVISHVRAATYTNNLKVVNKENSHPFMTDQLVLAHNGTLEFKDSKRMRDKKYKDMIDSQIFLNRLQEIYYQKQDKVSSVNELPFQDVLSGCMEEFDGKFAFLIYNKPEDNYYIVRGFTADLHISYLVENESRIGYVINTDKKDLEKGLDYFREFSFLTSGRVFSYDEPKILRFERVYLAEPIDVKEIGEIKETKPVRVVENTRNRWDNWGNATNTDKDIKDFLKEIDEFGLTLYELDELIYFTIGIPLLACDDDDLKYFLINVLPVLKRNYTEDKLRIWEKIRSMSFDPIEIYNTYKLQFPYTENSKIALGKALKDIKKDYEEAAKELDKRFEEKENETSSESVF